MGIADDDDIRQDFLVEAGEILETLSEQLVELEQRPADTELLNAIFRGFHTVKGGAGFLQLYAMVECCHATENLFDILRNGKQAVTAELIDTVLQALDAINAQFEQVSRRQEAEAAPAQLLATLAQFIDGANDGAIAPPVRGANSVPLAAAVSTLGTGQGSGEITDAEFEQLLDAISAGVEPVSVAATATMAALDAAPESVPETDSSASGGDLCDLEFDALLDQLHGQGRGPTSKKSPPAAPLAAAEKPSPEPVSPAAAEITDAEFDSLLDQLHGKGRAPGAETKPSAIAQPAAIVSAADDVISEDEFEQLLDQLHGKGQGPGRQNSAATAGSGTADSAAAAAPLAASAPARSSPTQPPGPAQHSQATASGPMIAAHPGSLGKSSAAVSRDAVAADTSVRVDTRRLDDIMNMVGELVLVRNRLVRLGGEAENEALAKAVAHLDVVTADLQTSVMKTRMQPIRKVFGRFPRVVRDIARNLQKEIVLEMHGEDTDLDKNLVEALADPLVHLVRNAVDHGIELPGLRESIGKPRTGRIVLAAVQEGDHIMLSISDDGGGMDPQKLRAIAVEKGIMDADSVARLSDTDAFSLIFAPGFSTRKEVSDVSGRGVGMDVVKTRIAQLNGAIEIDSVPGEGTRINIKLPLTLAIMPTLMIVLEAQVFALPLVSVNEIFHMNLAKTHTVDGQECMTVRDKAIPIFHLKRWLVRGAANAAVPADAHVVVVSVGTRDVGLVVDQLIGQEEVVIKPLGSLLQGTPGMSGATITGDGTIALILDVPGLLQRYTGHS